MSSVILANDETLAAEIAEGTVLVDFMAEWCGPCKALSPVLDEVAAEYGDRLKVVKVNIDLSPAAVEQFKVRGVPSLYLLREGLVQATSVGAKRKPELVSFIEAKLG